MATPSIPTSGPQGQHALYRFFDSTGDLLYVGITLNPAARWEKHRHLKHWWHAVTNITLEHCNSREAALLAEAEAIAEERPRYNVVHSVAPAEPRGDRTVTCGYCGRRMIRYWDDEPAPGYPNQCETCNAIMCDAFDTGWKRAMEQVRG